MIKSRYKDLIVSGCSFTKNGLYEGLFSSWANILARESGTTLHNLAIPGAGNDHISKSILLYLEHNNFDPQTTLVIAMWSGVGRIDWITDASLSRFKNSYAFHHYYDKFNELVLGGNWWNLMNPNHLMKILIDYSKYQSDHSMALHSWLAMENLSNYLEKHGYDYRYTSFVNYKSGNIKGDAMIIDYFQELEKLELTLDMSHWINLNETDYLGDYTRKINALEKDNFHPRCPDGFKSWTYNILIPALINEGILPNQT